MAWRIHDHVVKGEIDNSKRGIVRGKVWLEGFQEPVRLELEGNACADLAGCVLRFRNPEKAIALRADQHFNPVQEGRAGDMTASRKVRVLEMPYLEYKKVPKHKRKPLPFANALYLEWYSKQNGRVVIESTGYELEISQPAWRLSPEEEAQRQADSEKGFASFLDQLNKALDSARHQPPEDKEWDEFDYEKFLRESDARTDKYGELLDKYGDSADSEEIIAREMGWSSELSSPEESEEGEVYEANEAEENDFLEDIAPDPKTEGVDWIREEDGGICHPLTAKVREGSLKFWREYEQLGLGDLENAALEQLLSSWQILGAKLAGALDSAAYGFREGAFVVACLKRALPFLHEAQSALEKVAPQNLLPVEKVQEIRNELFATREEILRLMERFRSEGNQG